ncbi:unnamed protein product, partial [Sphagnum balticum]
SLEKDFYLGVPSSFDHIFTHITKDIYTLSTIPGGVVGGSLEDAVVGCGQKRPSSFLYPTSFDTPPAAAAAAGEEDQAGDVDQDGSDEYYCSGGHNNNNNAVESSKKRRLTFEQVRSLERNFELENKLEPERKMQLAKELGLQPRQVAVWFQNRRARWKTKQLERDYELLSSDYTRLKADFEVTVQEKERLKSELQKSTCNDVVICCPRPTLTPDGNLLQQQQDHLPPGGDSCLRALVSCSDDDDLGAATASPQLLHQQRPSTTSPSHVIKLEADGNSYQSDDHHSCNYFLSQLDEKAAMQPWWLDWS